MRTRSILMLASVAMILMATGIGNAFAYTYGGIPMQSEDHGSYATLTNWGSANVNISPGTSLGWANDFWNRDSQPDEAILNYWTTPTNGALTLNGVGWLMFNPGGRQTITYSGSTSFSDGTQETIYQNHLYETWYQNPRTTATSTGLQFY